MAEMVAAVPRQGGQRRAIGRLSAGAVIVAAGLGGGVGLLTSTAYPQFADPVSGAFGPAGAVLTVLHVLMLAGIGGLALGRGAGTGRFATLAYAVAMLGLAGQAIAEALLRFNFQEGNALFGYVVPLMAVGFVLVGIAVLRSRAWDGWHRFTPLVCGLYVPVVLIPAFALSHGVSFPALTVWQIPFLLLGLAMWSEAR